MWVNPPDTMFQAEVDGFCTINTLSRDLILKYWWETFPVGIILVANLARNYIMWKKSALVFNLSVAEANANPWYITILWGKKKTKNWLDSGRVIGFEFSSYSDMAL